MKYVLLLPCPLLLLLQHLHFYPEIRMVKFQIWYKLASAFKNKIFLIVSLLKYSVCVRVMYVLQQVFLKKKQRTKSLFFNSDFFLFFVFKFY